MVTMYKIQPSTLHRQVIIYCDATCVNYQQIPVEL